MLKKILGLICIGLFTFSFGSYAQRYTLSGFIKDAENGETLINARVYIDSLKVGTVSNSFGFYSLTLEKGIHTVTFSFVGKTPIKSLIKLDEDKNFDMHLKPVGHLKTVLVSHEKEQFESTEMGTVELSMEKVKTLPVLLGEQDIIKTAQLLPGIQSGSEGSSGVYVRGGGPDQNLILLDGVPIYNANHLFGFFSVFNADAIKQVKIIKGGFPAEYSGRISSVVDIRMNDGDMKKIHGEGSVGIISSKLMLNGPIVKDKTSFMISARRTYLDILSKPILKSINKNKTDEQKTNLGYYFYDINAKINHIINTKNRIYLSFYLGNDRFKLNNSANYTDTDSIQSTKESSSGMDWGNKIIALNWNHQFNPKLFMNSVLNYSSYKFETRFGNNSYHQSKPDKKIEEVSFQYNSGITDFGGKLNFTYFLNPRNEIKFGLGETYHTFNPGINEIYSFNSISKIDTMYSTKNVYAHELNAFIQNDFKIGRRFQANLGLNYANFFVRNNHYGILEPRINLNIRLQEKSSIKLSYAKTSQFLHLLTNTTIGLPTDLWVPVTDKIPPQIGHQFALGYAHQLNRSYRFNIEGYYKKMSNLIEYKEGASFFNANQNWENKVEIGKGDSYGVELLFEKRFGKTTGWIGYTLSWANRFFENINDGKEFPYRYDRRHDISFVLTHKFNEKISIGAVWVYGTGNAVTMAFQKYQKFQDGEDNLDYDSQTINHYEKKNNYRMRAYHRLDLSLNIVKEKKWGQAKWSFGLYNAYNRKNPFYLDIGYKKNNEGFGFTKKALIQYSLFPILPSISYSFKF
ncbi:TonB-dependent receptor [Crocinitomix catalasitica]|uniref:TonB-dependent receptor n=1 Tax=Crocinitomix catalasitica TaxID=184607 RepID=UPI00055D05DC|nr:TonB-dependent receptor plug domain-containing protein [Crocinitomix catalasitica]